MSEQDPSSERGPGGAGSTAPPRPWVPSPPPEQHGRRTHRLWWVLVAVITVAGVAGSLLAARTVARAEGDRSRTEFQRSAADVAARVELAIQAQEDLVVNTNAFVSIHGFAQSDFRAWASAARLLDRFPGVLGVGLVEYVPAAALADFVARVEADPPAALASGSFELTPPGRRDFYCLTALGVSRQPQLLDVGADWCADSGLGDNRDTGRSAYQPVTIATLELLAVQVPVYRDGVLPASVEARREAFVGWVGTVSIPGSLLDAALEGYPHLAASMQYQLGEGVHFSAREMPADPESETIDLSEGWTLTVFRDRPGTGVLSHGDALAVLAGGVAFTVLLVALVLVLSAGRAMALRMVGQRTGELRHQALHDALTGLPNRALIMDRIEQMLVRNRRDGTTGAAYFLDLDDFKNINDARGHAAGDRLLVAVAARLTSALRRADTVGRMGGDEFVVLSDGAELDAAPELVAQRLLDVLQPPFHLEGVPTPLTVTASIGVATGDRTTGGDLLRDADVALYAAKASGRNRYEVFDPGMQSEINRRIELEFDLRSAVDGDQLRLVYQPIYELGELGLVGFEALLRWDHPALGEIGLAEWIPILERSGQIREVGRRVLMEACADMAAWNAGGADLRLSVNVSGRQLDDDSIVHDVRDALAASGLDPSALVVEVTETSLMHNVASTASRLRAIKELGVAIAIDDFGTGYSSLAYLGQFPVDSLKIDRSFVNAVASSPEANALIQTFVGLGQALGLEVLAEGIEDSLQLAQLRAEHCDNGQGFLLARPLAPEAIELLLDRLRDAPDQPVRGPRTGVIGP